MVIKKNINVLILLICLHQFTTFDIRTLIKKKYSQINNIGEAMQHYKSYAGGTVKAGSKLISDIKSSIKKVMKNEAQKIANNIKSKLPGKRYSGSGNVYYAFCLTLGHFDFQYTYSLTVQTNKKCKINFTCSGQDLWDFDHEKSQNLKRYFRNLMYEDIPSSILGPGREFYISYRFTYTVDV